MNNCTKFMWILAVMISVIIPAAAMGQLAADKMSFQAQLKDNGGNPVPDDTYIIDFSVWDDMAAGTTLWTEQRSVTTSDGYFQLYLGESNPLSQDVFGDVNDTSGRWLQFQVAGDNPMTPRTELGITPFSFLSTRVNGDIKTQPGVAILGEDNTAQILISGSDPTEAEMLFLAGDEPGRTIQLDANSGGAIIAMTDPKATRTYPDVTISGDATGAGVLLADPRPSPEFATIDIFSGNGSGGISLADPRPSPSFSTISIFGDQSGGKISLADPRPSPAFASLNIFSGDGNGSISLADPRPSPTFADVTISGDATGSGILLADPRPSPSFGSLQLRSDATGSSVALADPRPSPSVPDLLLVSDQTGSELAFGEVSGLGLIEDEVIVLGATNNKGEISIYDTANELAVDIVGDSSGGSMELFESSSQARLTMNPSGINIYDSGGTLAAVFEPNGVEAGKGDFGFNNTNSGNYAFVTGQGNTAGGAFSATIAGSGNSSSGGSSAVVGGVGNSASFGSAFVGGGQTNTASGLNSFVGGGNFNTASNDNAVVMGGVNNEASGLYSFVHGSNNSAASGGAVVVGGHHNAVGSSRSVICGGEYNTVTGIAPGSMIAGGSSNTIDGSNSFIAGGDQNQCTGVHSAIVSGVNDTIDATVLHSMAVGKYVYIGNSYRAAFFDGSFSGYLTVNRDDHDGTPTYPLQVGTSSSNGNGAYLTAGGVWTNGSSRAFKENGRPLVGQALLEKISNLDIDAWNYKNSDERHVGPYAEDFTAAFDVGATDENSNRENQYLAAADVAGVALAGVKELLTRIEQLEARIAELEEKQK